MSEFIVFVLFFAVLGLVIKVVNLSKDVGYLRRQLKRLEERFSVQGSSSPLAAALDVVKEGAPQPQEIKKEPVPVAQKEVVQEALEEWEEFPEEVSTPTKKTEPKESSGGWEQNIGTKLPVWIGSVALIFAAFYLVKYSIDAGLLSPAVRLFLGGVMGCSLVAGGQWLVHRSAIANSLRISQAMVGAGLVSLYFCLYAAAKMYDFMPEIMAFVGMSAVTIVGLVMALRHGQVIAGFALVGGLLTPALLSTGEGDVVGLFAYLFLLVGSVMAIVVRRGAWVMGGLALAGAYIWTFLWITISSTNFDAFILCLFALGLCFQVLVLTARYIQKAELEEGLSKEDRTKVHGLNFIAFVGGVLTVLWLSDAVVLGLFEWAVMGLFSAALMFLSYFKPDMYVKPLFVKMAVTIGMMVFWMERVNFLEQTIVLVSFAALYVAVPLYLMKRAQCPKAWSVIQCAGALALFLVGYFGMDMPLDLIQSFDGFWGICAFGLAAGFVYLVQEVQWKFGGAKDVRDYMVACYAFTASAFIALGVCIVLPSEYIPMAFAAQIMGTCWIYSRVKIEFLKKNILILSVITLLLYLSQVFLVFSLSLYGLMGRYPGFSAFERLIEHDFLFKLGVPTLLLFLGARFYHQASGVSDFTYRFVSGFAACGALLMMYYGVRWSFTLFDEYAVLMAEQAGFMERALVTASFVALYFSLKVFAADKVLEKLMQALRYFIVARFVYFDLLVHNPYWDADQLVGDMVILNGVTFVYGAGFVLALSALMQRYEPKSMYTSVLLLSLFSFVSLSIAQFFHGSRLDVSIGSDIEFYSYSVGWLLAGIGLLALGIYRKDKSIRMASLGFMILTVIKVFLFDASELQGLYRVLSFLGLGLSLMGLSYFYHRYVFQGIMVDDTKNK